MATPINAPMAGEIWHLSIDDLFQPVQEAPRLGGEGPFVINLSASTAPISIPANAFAGCSDAHVYQIQVTEDGRTRYRLRLGPFATEDEADAVLAVVRDTYPGALTATAGASDSRVIGSMQAKVEARQASARKPVDTADTEKSAPEKPATDKADAEISFDIAWPTPVLAVPPTRPVRAAPVAIPSVAAAPLELAPEWTLPKLDIPPPSSRESNLAAKGAPVLTEVVVPAVKEVVAPAVKAPVPRMAAPTPAVAPVLTDAVAAKAKAPVVTAPAAAQATTPKPAATSAVPAPTFVAPVAPPPKAAAPVAPVPVAPVPVAVTPVPARIAQPAPEPAAKQTATPAKPAPPKVVAPPPRIAAPPPRIAAPPPRIAAPPPRIAAPPPRIAAPLRGLPRRLRGSLRRWQRPWQPKSRHPF